MGFCLPRITVGLICFFVGGGTFLRKVYSEKIWELYTSCPQDIIRITRR